MNVTVQQSNYHSSIEGYLKQLLSSFVSKSYNCFPILLSQILHEVGEIIKICKFIDVRKATFYGNLQTLS